MSDTFSARVEGMRFAAAHFATFSGECEPLHGHSYEVALTVEGTLTADAWAFDFVELKSLLRGLCDELDHRFLLQRESAVLVIEETETNWKVRTPAGTGYVLPHADVVPLPLDNTTAERLAEWLSARVEEALLERGAANLSTIEVEVWEGPGQRAAHRRRRLPATPEADNNA